MPDKKTLDLNKLAKEVVADISRSDNDRISIMEFCRRKLQESAKGLSVLQVEDIIPSFAVKTKSLFQKNQEDKRNRGITPEYELVEYPPDTLLRYDLSHREDGLSYVRKHRNEILKAITRMNWRNFEFLCEHLLSINRIIITGVSRGTKEGGIDFYGLLEMNRFSDGVLLRDARVRIIGQAKRYGKVVDHADVRVFKTHRDELIQNTGDAVNRLPSWFIESKDPLLSFLVVTTKFTRGGKTFAKKNNIILREGEQVVEDLTKSPNVREWFSRKNGKLTFNETLFMRFFEEKKSKEIKESTDS